MICKPFKTPSLSLRILQQLHIMPSFKYKRHTKSEYYRQAGTLCAEMGFIWTFLGYQIKQRITNKTHSQRNATDINTDYQT